MLLIDENVESDVYVRCLVVYLCCYLNSVVVKSMWFKIDVYFFLKYRILYM